MRFDHPHKLIGLTGRAGSGKDTVAAKLRLVWWALDQRRTTVPRTAVLAFADPIRDMLRQIGVPDVHMHDRALKEQPVPGIGRSYRELAQTLGTEWGRQLVADDLWVRLMAERLRESVAAAEDVGMARLAIITDVRLPNEAALVRELGGVLVRIERPGIEPVREHSSEQAVDALPADHVLINDGDLTELGARVRALAKTLGLHEEAAA